jgi:hypothetical protein
LITARASSLVVEREGKADEWTLETLVKRAFKPNKITIASQRTVFLYNVFGPE